MCLFVCVVDAVVVVVASVAIAFAVVAGRFPATFLWLNNLLLE